MSVDIQNKQMMSSESIPTDANFERNRFKRDASSLSAYGVTACRDMPTTAGVVCLVSAKRHECRDGFGVASSTYVHALTREAIMKNSLKRQSISRCASSDHSL